MNKGWEFVQICLHTECSMLKITNVSNFSRLPYEKPNWNWSFIEAFVSTKVHHLLIWIFPIDPKIFELKVGSEVLKTNSYKTLLYFAITKRFSKKKNVWMKWCFASLLWHVDEIYEIGWPSFVSCMQTGGLSKKQTPTIGHKFCMIKHSLQKEEWW